MEGSLSNLCCFDPLSVGRDAAAAFHRSIRLDVTGISTEPKRTALVDVIVLTGHKVDNLMLTQSFFNDPATVFQTITSRETMENYFTSVSRLLNSFIKYVGIPAFRTLHQQIAHSVTDNTHADNRSFPEPLNAAASFL